VKTTVGLIDAIFGVIARILRVRIGLEEFGINDKFRKSTTNRVLVTDSGPLRLVEERVWVSEQLSNVV